MTIGKKSHLLLTEFWTIATNWLVQVLDTHIFLDTRIFLDIIADKVSKRV
jgi:hypothetical protein